MTLNEILADVKQEGADPFKEFDPTEINKETETPAESSTPKKPEGKKPDQGDNTDEDKTPFSIRWKSHAENLKSELEAKHQEELSKLRQEFDAKIPPKETNIPDWFKELYGENEVAWQKYAEHSQQEREQMKKDILAEQETKREEAKKEETYWNGWVEEGIKSLQATGLEFDRNALIKTMLDNPKEVTNALGNFDFNLGYKLYREKNPISQVNTDARKKLADTTTKSSSTEKSSKDYKTSNDLRNMSWNQL